MWSLHSHIKWLLMDLFFTLLTLLFTFDWNSVKMRDALFVPKTVLIESVPWQAQTYWYIFGEEFSSWWNLTSDADVLNQLLAKCLCFLYFKALHALKQNGLNKDMVYFIQLLTPNIFQGFYFMSNNAVLCICRRMKKQTLVTVIKSISISFCLMDDGSVSEVHPYCNWNKSISYIRPLGFKHFQNIYSSQYFKADITDNIKY